MRGSKLSRTAASSFASITWHTASISSPTSEQSRRAAANSIPIPSVAPSDTGWWLYEYQKTLTNVHSLILHKGVLRQMWRFKPNQLPVGQARTDSAGRFGATVPLPSPELSVHFEGDSRRRSAVSLFN